MSSPNSFNPVALIRKKREGEALSDEELSYLISSYTRDEIPDYQMSAFLMAAFLNGLNDREASSMTHSMLHSGRVLDLGNIPGIKVDKHSTGGVGDKLSLILAPIVASCDVPVPMISGRGLGHTGGTLDKLESITGFTVDMTLDDYQQILGDCRMVMAGATEDIAPADKRLYALRDVTATVESIPFIASSIMSKKLAEGIDALVLDVKFGSGAFMKTREDALQLAETLVSIGEHFGKRTIAYLTSMEQPLGYHIGNWLEAKESIEALKGNGPEDVMEITHQLSGTMIWLGGEANSIEEGIEKSREAISSGKALDKWRELVERQGGDTGLIDNPDTYPNRAESFEIEAGEDGYVQAMDAYEIGMASVELGAGRKKKGESIDPAAGIILRKKIGDPVKKGETIASAFTNNDKARQVAGEMIRSAVAIGEKKPESIPLVTHKVDKKGILEISTHP
ncbi:MAG: thymidine phosphorylase [Balneolaceae bacterium]|nr:thymidine phosphorylase [Balneolaceae bacterium]